LARQKQKQGGVAVSRKANLSGPVFFANGEWRPNGHLAACVVYIYWEYNMSEANPETAPTETPRGNLTVRVMAMPADTNASGDLFGGWVLSQMDIAGGIASSERARGRTVTLKLDGMIFHRPVKVGDTLCVYTELEHVGRTSMRYHIEAWTRRYQTYVREKVTDATFVFVAVDANGRPRPVPKEA
jgi:acyl-CoA thioesterase YciA